MNPSMIVLMVATPLLTSWTPRVDAAPTPVIAGYNPVSNVNADLAASKDALEAFAVALDAVPPDWASARAAYLRNDDVEGSTSLRALVQVPTRGDSLFQVFASFYGSHEYAHSFVGAALDGSGDFKGLSNKARVELAMKGLVLQGLLMASLSRLQAAVELCREKTLADADGAPHFVDSAWALYAGSEDHGPIRLAEKRAAQFDVMGTPFSEAGASMVNIKLLAIFKELQGSAQQGDCDALQSRSKNVTALMMVPVIQGLLREAYEVDPKEVKEHHGADGFIEVVEGWAFARAVLPLISKCSPAAAKRIRANMDTIGRGFQGPHLEDGYLVVKSALESTYACLGVSCKDVNAMLKPFKTGKFLWQPCDDANLPAMDGDGLADNDVSAAIRGAGGVLMSALGLLVYLTSVALVQ